MRRNLILLNALFVLLVAACSGKKEEKDQSAPGAESTAKIEEEHPGKPLFKQHCSVCHQADGSGVPGMYPPLSESEYVQGDVKWLVTTIVKGLEGPITVKGKEYNNLMPAMAYLKDAEIAHILSYVRKNFGNNAGEVTEAEVSEIRRDLQ